MRAPLRTCRGIFGLGATAFAAPPRQAVRCTWLGLSPAFRSASHLQIKAGEEGQVMEVFKQVGDFVKRGEAVATLYVHLPDERGGMVGDEDELNMDGCEGLTGHHKVVTVKAEQAGEVVEILADDIHEVEADDTMAVIEPMTKSAWASRAR
eukprot:TRINITY_DN24719_c0_g1_i1.p1 TRINITY_DN24719_c0_g1~~TRINITY_DN24719_c0_g1_i1.p1  ORF type:complete len:151 (-),score=38.87 TRINITY_DN24719_c0_g1_i1:150-602(-)